MAAGIFVFDILVTLILSCYLLYSYGNLFRQTIAVTLAVLIAWYFSFLIIFILPLDVSNTVYKQCLNAFNGTLPASITSSPNITSTPTPDLNDNEELVECKAPRTLLPDQVLLDLWRVVYWSSQALTWFILPMMQSYSLAGEFTVAGKLKSALWDNSIYYASYLFIALILVIYIALQPDIHLNSERLKAIAAAAANTWGLFVLVLMLGYGLVEVPRNCWKSSQRGYQLNRAYFKVAKLITERSDAEESVEDAIMAANAASQVLGQADVKRPMVEIILRKIPLEKMEKVRRRTTENQFNNDLPTEKSLVRLHRQVIKSLKDLRRTEAQWADLTRHVIELEDINRNMVSNEHSFKHSPHLGTKKESILDKTLCNPTLEWYWKCLISPLFLRLAAGMACLMSFFVIWSEVTFCIPNPTLSLFAVFINLASDNHNYGAIEIISFLTICYLSLCTYYTIFKIRVLNYYYLAKNHQSDEYTLLFSGALLCRLTPPLCLNFLSLIRMDSHVIESQIMETSYTQVMGHMDVISIISDYFNIYFPIALLGLSLATYFSLGARILSMVGFQQFLDQDSEVTLDMVEEGKEHIRREKRRLQRLYESNSRRREFSDRMRDDQELGTSRDIEMGRYGSSSGIIRGSQGAQNIISSPEKALLDGGNQQHSKSPSRPDYASQVVVDASAGSPNSESNSPPKRRTREPPRNLFDDW